MSTDFRAERLRSSALIASRSDAGNPSMIIYSASNANNFTGGIADSGFLDGAGKDVFLFVSGTKTDSNTPRGSIKGAVALFGGDLVVSGTLYADRQVIEIDETVTGSLSISGSLFVSRSLDAGQNILLNTAQQGGGYINFNGDEGASGYGFRTSGGTLQFKNVGGSWANIGTGGGGLSYVTGTFNVPTPSNYVTTASVSIAGGEGLTHNINTVGTDVYFYVSGSRNSAGSDQNMAVFGGDVVLSGTHTIQGFTSVGNGHPRGDMRLENYGVAFSPMGEGSAAQFRKARGTITAPSAIQDGDGLGDVIFQGYQNSAFRTSARIRGRTDGIPAGNFAPGSLEFHTGDDSSIAAPRMVISSSGKIGVGTSSPHELLDVRGNIASTGYVSASMGLSGSLTRLTDGKSYIIAGDNITVSSASNGSVTIAAAGGFSSWTIQGDSGNTTVLSGQTVDIAGGNGIFTAESARTVTVHLDYDGVNNFIESHADTATIASGDKILFHDITDDDVKKTTVSGIVDLVSFDVAGDSGSDQTITNGNTLTIAGGVGIDSAAGATDTITLTLDVSELSALGTTADTSDYVVIQDATDNSTKKVLISNLPSAGSSEWTDEGDILRPADGSSENVGIGGTGTTETDYDIMLKSNGAAVFNEQNSNLADFRIEGGTANYEHMFFVDTSTQRIGIGRTGNSPSSVVHIKDTSPEVRIQRQLNGQDSVISFAGSGGVRGSMTGLAAGTNDIVFKVFNGSNVEEILRLGDHYGVNNRQVILLSGSRMHAGAMQPREISDIGFFVSGSIGSKGGTTQGTAVLGGDTVVSGALFVEGYRPYEGAVGAAIILNSQPGNSASRIVWDTESDGNTPDAAIYEDGGEFILSSSDKVIINGGIGRVQIGTMGEEFLRAGSTGGQKHVTVNEVSKDIDFRVESNALLGALLVDAGTDQVLIGSNQLNAAGESLGTDVNIFFNGAQNSKDGGTKGTAVFKGDLLTSGTLFIEGSSDYKGSTAAAIVLSSVPDTNSRIVWDTMAGSDATGLPDAQIYEAGGELYLSGVNDVIIRAETDDVKIEPGDRLSVYERFGASGNFTSFFAQPTEGVFKNVLDIGDSGVTINDDGEDNLDFRIETSLRPGMFAVDAGEHQIMMGSSKATVALEGLGSDVSVFVSGTVGSKNVAGSKGTFVVSGDTLLSGVLHCAGVASYQGAQDIAPAIVLDNQFASAIVWDSEADGLHPDAAIYESVGDLYVSASRDILMYPKNRVAIVEHKDATGAFFEVFAQPSAGLFRNVFDVGDYGAVVNEDGRTTYDFRAESTLRAGMFQVDAATDVVMMNSSQTTKQTESNAGPGLGLDVAVLMSGSRDGKNSTSNTGVVLASGDLVVSGAIYEQDQVRFSLYTGETTDGTPTFGSEEAVFKNEMFATMNWQKYSDPPYGATINDTSGVVSITSANHSTRRSILTVALPMKIQSGGSQTATVRIRNGAGGTERYSGQSLVTANGSMMFTTSVIIPAGDSPCVTVECAGDLRVQAGATLTLRNI